MFTSSADPQVLPFSAPKGDVFINVLMCTGILYRCSISSVCIILMSDVDSHRGMSLQDLVICIATVDLVVGELDR